MTNKKVENTKKSKNATNLELRLFKKTSISTLEAADDSILQIWLQNQFHTSTKKKK